MTVRLQKTVWPLGGLGILPSSQMSCPHPPSNPWFLCLEKGRQVIAPVTRAPGRGLAEGARDLGTGLLRVPLQPEHWKPVFPPRLQEAQPIPLPCVRVCERVPVLGCVCARPHVSTCTRCAWRGRTGCGHRFCAAAFQLLPIKGIRWFYILGQYQNLKETGVQVEWGVGEDRKGNQRQDDNWGRLGTINTKFISFPAKGEA